MTRQDEYGYYSKRSFWQWARRTILDRKIIRADNQPFPDGTANGIAHEPILYLDNGTVLSFKPRVTAAGDVSIWLAVDDVEQPSECQHLWTILKVEGFWVKGLRNTFVRQCALCFDLKED